MSVEIPEIFVLLTIGATWLIPVAASVWALVTLHRIRSAQEEMLRKLDAIERQIQCGTTP